MLAAMAGPPDYARPEAPGMPVEYRRLGSFYDNVPVARLEDDGDVLRVVPRHTSVAFVAVPAAGMVMFFGGVLWFLRDTTSTAMLAVVAAIGAATVAAYFRHCPRTLPFRATPRAVAGVGPSHAPAHAAAPGRNIAEGRSRPVSGGDNVLAR